MAEVKSSRLELLKVYDEYLDVVDRELDAVSDQLYSGKLSMEKLVNLVMDVNEIDSDLIKFYLSLKEISEIEDKYNKKWRNIFRLSFIINAVLVVLGNVFLAAVLAAIQVYLYGLIKKESAAVADYICSVIEKSDGVDRRVEHYRDIVDIKLEKQMKEEVGEAIDDEKILEFEKALNVVNALLNDENVPEFDEETGLLARKIMEDGGAQGDTLEELAKDMKEKAIKQIGGRTLTNDKK